jgi:TRAP-type C4-dicarboxylate transport system permease large subunit
VIAIAATCGRQVVGVAQPAIAPLRRADGAQDTVPLLKSLWPVAVIFGVVMGGIYGGFFTSIEASGIGASAAMVFALTHHADPRRSTRFLVDTAKTSAMMFAIILGAALFGEFVNMTGVHQSLLKVVQGSGLPPFGIILLMIVLYILLGSVLESLSMILLTVPIFFPSSRPWVRPVWFGILIVMWWRSA